MSVRRNIGIVIVVIGAVCMGVSYYIMQQVGAGTEQIKSAQESVDKGNNFFSNSSNPIVKGMGQNVTGSAQKKINAGKEQVLKYTALAGQLKTTGIALIVIGAIVALVPSKKK
jgi:hypothetical protein